MSPEQYRKRYLHYELKIGTPQRLIVLDLNGLRYRNASREGFTKTSPEMLAKDAVQGKVPANWKSKIQAAYNGKGSPEGIAKALETVAEYNLWDKGDPKWAVGLNGLTIEEKLKRYCHRMIGLDCLGFAVNYTQQEKGLLTSLSPLNADLPDFRKTPFLPRATVLEFRTGDAVVWEEPPRHIALLGNLPSLGMMTGSFPLVMAAADENLGSEGVFSANYAMRPAGVLGKYQLTGKIKNADVRVFGPKIETFKIEF
jgi:hypothetical protein